MVNAEKILENTEAIVTGTTEVVVEDPKQRRGSVVLPKAKVLRPFNTSEVKILLLENVNETAVKAFTKQGYQVRKIFGLMLGKKIIHVIVLCAKI